MLVVGCAAGREPNWPALPSGNPRGILEGVTTPAPASASVSASATASHIGRVGPPLDPTQAGSASGWHCWHSLVTSVSGCHRSIPECQSRHGALTAEGLQLSPCAFQNDAFCYGRDWSGGHYLDVHCAPSEERCESSLTFNRRLLPELAMSPCVLVR